MGKLELADNMQKTHFSAFSGMLRPCLNSLEFSTAVNIAFHHLSDDLLSPIKRLPVPSPSCSVNTSYVYPMTTKVVSDLPPSCLVPTHCP